MNPTRTFRIEVNGGEAPANLGEMLAADTIFRDMSRTFSKVRFSVPDDAGGTLQLSILGYSTKTAPDSEIPSNFLAIGDFREYEMVDLDLVWVQSVDDTVLEGAGNPL